jgi:hypothetical protein
VLTEHADRALVPYVIEPDEIYIPVRPVRVEPAALDSARARKAVSYVEIEVERIKIRSRSRKRGTKIAAGVVALVVLMVATAGTLMSAPRVTAPALPAPPAMLAALPTGPLTALDTKELTVVDGVSGITTDPLFPSAAQFSRVMLVRGQGRTSMALEMTAEPSRATFRALSPTVLEIEAGPTIGPVNPGWFVSSALPLLNQVSIRKLTRDHHDYVQARVRLNAAGSADVRVVGRVVYVDFK